MVRLSKLPWTTAKYNGVQLFSFTASTLAPFLISTLITFSWPIQMGQLNILDSLTCTHFHIICCKSAHTYHVWRLNVMVCWFDYLERSHLHHYQWAIRQFPRGLNQLACFFYYICVVYILKISKLPLAAAIFNAVLPLIMALTLAPLRISALAISRWSKIFKNKLLFLFNWLRLQFIITKTNGRK